jgi:hypothetical protein
MSETVSTIAHSEKIQWLQEWCARNGVRLQLEGECGFGRECVGIAAGSEGTYPDYQWYDDDFERVDSNGEVWIPEHAYHKHPCVAVLGRGEGPEAELYDWIRWFDANGFKPQTSKNTARLHPLEIAMGRGEHHRMVKG